MLPQNLASRILKRKEFEKMSEAERSLWPPPSCPPSFHPTSSPFFPEPGYKTPQVRGALPTLRGGQHPYLWKQRGSERNPNKGASRRIPTPRPCCFLQFTAMTPYSLTYRVLPWLSTLQQTDLKYSVLIVSLGLHFLVTAPMSCKLY